MKIAFSKVSNQNLPFEISLDNLVFKGNLKRIDSKLINCEGLIIGILSHICDRCGSELNIKMNEKVELILSDGIYKDLDGSIKDIMEFFDESIDMNEVMHSEIEAFKSDYFYCDNCKNL